MTTLQTQAGTPSSHMSTSNPAEVTPAQAQRWLGAGEAVLIDVRQPDEHAREHIDGAVLMPLHSFDAAKAAALAKPGQRIVLHCKSGRRSADACRMALSFPGAMPPVASMVGGIEAWKQQNLPVVVDTRVARMSIMRQVQLVIGAGVLTGSALAYFVHPAFIGIAAFFGAGLVFAGATGTCGLAVVIGMMPWNKTVGACSTSCSSG